MDFVVQWLSYLLAFVAGSAVSWLIVTLSIKRAGDNKDKEEVPADVSGSTEMGAR